MNTVSWKHKKSIKEHTNESWKGPKYNLSDSKYLMEKNTNFNY